MTSHKIVDKNNQYKRIEIKEINACWRNSINTPEDDGGQLCNRYTMFNVDESLVQDELVYLHQIEKLAFGGDDSQNNEDFLVGKALTDIIKKDPINVFVPYAHLLQLSDKSNRRSFPKFLNFIKCVTYVHRFQRKKIMGYHISTYDDLEIAKLVWDKVNKMESLHIRSKDQLVLAVLGSDEWMSIDDIHQNPDVNKTMSRNAVNHALFKMKEQGYVDRRKSDIAPNKYEWQAFRNLSQLSINFSKEKFTRESLKHATSSLLSNVTFLTSQIPVNTEDEQFEQLFQEITSPSVNFEKLKSLIQKDEEKTQHYEKQVEEGKLAADKLMISSEKKGKIDLRARSDLLAKGLPLEKIKELESGKQKQLA